MLNIADSFTSELNPAQKQAVENPINSCTKVVAGAGTGKTKIISKRFVKLVFDLINENAYTPTSRILVITFTDKAAKEMKNRIIKELDKNNLNSYGDELWISTFHGFCSKFLRTHCIEANLSPEFELAEEQTLTKVYEKIIKTLKYNEYKTFANLDKLCEELDLESDILNAESLKKLGAISNLDNIFDNIFNIIKKIKSLGLTPKEFLHQTKTATIGYSQTVQNIPFGFSSPEEYLNAWSSLFREYKANNENIDIETFGKIADKKIIIDKNRSPKAQNWSSASKFPECIEEFTQYELNLTEIIALIYAIYQNELELADIIDFDDLINKTVLILKNNGTLRNYYQEYFKHLIVDEFQDTNGAQLELIKLLLNENHSNITFVGDRKQSIYGFRYAQMENLEVLHKYIEEKYGTKYPEIKLETNYRSDANILNAVNFITTNHLNINEPLTPSDLHLNNTNEKYVKNTKIYNFQFSYEQKTAEANYIANEILNLKQTDNVRFQDFAILVKAHSQAEQIERILSTAGIPAIKRTNTGFFTHPIIRNAISLLQLLKNPIDDIALTRLLKIDFSDKKLYELKKLIDEIIYKEKLNDDNKKLNLCEKILKLYEINKLPQNELSTIYDAILQAVQDKKDKSILQIFVYLSNKITLYKPTSEIDKFQSEHNIKRFEKIILDYEQNRKYSNLNDFLEYFDKIKDDRNFELPTVLNSDIDAVQILTIHASKGLEFPYVFVCSITSKEKNDNDLIKLDLQYGKKPGFGLIVSKLNETQSPKLLLYKQLWQTPRNYAENLRVFYVAASRAIKYLNILTFESQSHYKSAEYTQDFPSYISEETINTEDIKKLEGIYALPSLKPEEPLVQSDIITNKSTKKTHTFSFSKLNTYTICPQKFLLKYHYYFPSQNFAQKATETGSIIHKLIYNSFLFEKELTKEEIDLIIPDNISDYEKTRIYNLYSCFAHSKYAPKALKNNKIFSEKSFNFIYKLNERDIEFSGDIDLLIENEDKTYTIIDFKTNINLKNHSNEYQKQLFLYKKALESDNLKVKYSLMCGLQENDSIEEIMLQDENKIKSEFDEELEKAIECIENPFPQKKQNEEQCSSCGYNYLCKIFD